MSETLMNRQITNRLRVVLDRRESVSLTWFCIHTGEGSADPNWFDREQIEKLRDALTEALRVDAKENTPCPECNRVGSPLSSGSDPA